MPSEAKAPQLGRTRLVTGLVAFILTFALGGAASLLLVSQFKTTVEETARRDVSVIGGSLARALAQQFEKAARFGIPLKLLPGVESYLAQTLTQTPGITRIVVRGPDGREVRSAIGPTTGTDTVSAPIQVDGLSVGLVEVTTSPTSFSAGIDDTEWRMLGAVASCALVSGLLAAWLAGGALNRRRQRFVTALERNLDGDLDPGPYSAAIGRSSVARAFHALSMEARRIGAKVTAFQAYAEELLAVDFDGQLRPEVERIRREALPAPVHLPTTTDDTLSPQPKRGA
ncbi:hypothetical protein DFO45_4315 [Azorhizobium sp. AG788]|uniref:hypothetical protein n=1 Tax=Azorhizobium sp. AG788 TaxID=2183897 RepID=UPI0010D2A54D|nr:hypothetical protein [Azorhizobium sp. AG788]TDT89398.1 hypothetical protein DFO45_4315 [Azorhizobium sp. AG788]